MFKVKAKKTAMDTIHDSLVFGSGLLAGRMSEGMKQANSHIINMNEYVKKNPGLSYVKKSIEKNPTGSLMALAGLGFILIGIISLSQKK